MAVPLASRKCDLLYLLFFAIHIPIMFLVDLAPFYPDSFRPQVITAIREWYIKTYRDQFFSSPPAWFNAYLLLEALYHLPLSIWAIGALKRDDPKIPLHLLIFALEAGMTTMTCIADYLSWDISRQEKIDLGFLYVPYLALAVFMGIDMFCRLNSQINSRVQKDKKQV
ncbi:hypothetical protein L228DRAFT_280624 [Xylona heveae TC161]|uniref:Efficient mitochondria targeting-associated protein 19 n=1 Tax=Xylona heveae (strain CBS 132557 / TC161) TaxID=1328760 RepID=A0A165ITU5_XYLHT|nr:hypothetical protein L228DRAFT_280624 [Xylona heveae TC161]KZF25383.1 hypothetical protein L228DRAFT_280624 [Xylona heveae TC161]